MTTRPQNPRHMRIQRPLPLPSTPPRPTRPAARSGAPCLLRLGGHEDGLVLQLLRQRKASVRRSDRRKPRAKPRRLGGAAPKEQNETKKRRERTTGTCPKNRSMGTKIRVSNCGLAVERSIFGASRGATFSLTVGLASRTPSRPPAVHLGVSRTTSTWIETGQDTFRAFASLYLPRFG